MTWEMTQVIRLAMEGDPPWPGWSEHSAEMSASILYVTDRDLYLKEVKWFTYDHIASKWFSDF